MSQKFDDVLVTNSVNIGTETPTDNKSKLNVVSNAEGSSPAVFVSSKNWNAIHAQTQSGVAAIAGIQQNENSTAPAIWAEHIGNGPGLVGKSQKQAGVYGESAEAFAVRGVSHANYHAGVSGINDNATHSAGPGVYGESNLAAGVFGESKNWIGVFGTSQSQSGIGVQGEVNTGTGVVGISKTWHGVYGETQSTIGGAGVWGEHKNGTGIVGKSETGAGIFGRSEGGEGIHGETNSPTFAAVAGIQLNANGTGPGIFGRSEGGEGIHGETNSPTFAAVAGIQLNANGTGAGIYGKHKGRGPAGFFKGDVLVTGDIQLLNADFAEDFAIADVATAEPGTVMAINDDGVLQPSEHAYDRRVAGVISGAGDYKPAIVLDKQHSINNRLPIALVGKVYCKVDASYAPVEVGDLLTTSPTPGHAMKATDPLKAFGFFRSLCGLEKGSAKHHVTA